MPLPFAEDALFISVGAVLGLLSRLGLARLFGPAVLDVVSATSPLFTDLPANAVGCLLTGAFAPAKDRTAMFHSSLAVGISTGFLGSTTSEFGGDEAVFGILFYVEARHGI